MFMNTCCKYKQQKKINKLINNLSINYHIYRQLQQQIENQRATIEELNCLAFEHLQDFLVRDQEHQNLIEERNRYRTWFEHRDVALRNLLRQLALEEERERRRREEEEERRIEEEENRRRRRGWGVFVYRVVALIIVLFHFLGILFL